MKTTGQPLRANPSVSERDGADAPNIPSLPGRPDGLGRATALLLLAAVVVLLPALFITADHLLRQKPAIRQQQAIFRAIGLSSPCLFPAGHPARTRIEAPYTVDWRLAPSLPQAAPGTIDLVRPRAAWQGGLDHAH